MAPDDRGAADPVPADATNRMKFCPNCQSQYPDDANFCPQEGCATGQGPRRLEPLQAGSAGGAAAALRAGSPAGRLAQRRGLPRARQPDGPDRRVQAGRTGVAADDGDAGTGAARAEAAAARPEPPARARARLRQGRRRAPVHRQRALRRSAAGPAGRQHGPAAARSREGDRRADRRGAAGRPEGRRRSPRSVAQERARLRQRRGQGDQLRGARRRLGDGVRRARVPVAGAGGGEAGRPALEHVQPGRHPDAAAVGPAARVGGRYRRHPGPGDEGRAGSSQPSPRGQHHANARDRPHRPEGDGQEPEPAAADDAAVPDRGERHGRAGRGADPRRRRRRIREDDAVFGRLARCAEAGAAGDRGPRRRGGEPGGAPRRAAPAPAPEPAPAYAATPTPAAETPAPTGPRRTHGAAIAATVVSMPAAKLPGMGTPMPGSSPNQSGQVTPPPMSATPAPVAMSPGSGPAPTPKPAAGGNFRETLWFKKGDVDQMVAEARQRVEAARAKGISVPDPEARGGGGGGGRGQRPGRSTSATSTTGLSPPTIARSSRSAPGRHRRPCRRWGAPSPASG